MIAIRPVKSMIQFKQTSLLLCITLIFTLSASSLCGESPSQKQNRLFVTFKNPAGENGIAVEKAGLASIKQEFPIEIEVYKSDSDIRRIHGGYSSIRKIENGLEAEANLAITDSVSIAVKDIWRFSDPILSLERVLRITGNDFWGLYVWRDLVDQDRCFAF